MTLQLIPDINNGKDVLVLLHICVRFGILKNKNLWIIRNAKSGYDKRFHGRTTLNLYRNTKLLELFSIW